MKNGLFEKKIPPVDTAAVSGGSSFDDLSVIEKKGSKWMIKGRDYSKYVAAAERYIREQTPVFTTLSGDRHLTYKLGKGFKINFETGEITLDIKDWAWAEDHHLSHEHILWSTCHEIAHFLDLKMDPEGMLKNFRNMNQWARDLAPQAEEAIKKSLGELPARLQKRHKLDPKDPNSETLTGLELMLCGKIATFYNCLDDIFVNKLVGSRISRFGLTQYDRRTNTRYHSDLVRQLYRDFLFATDPENPGVPPADPQLNFYDLTKADLHMQFQYALLRQRMVPDQGILIAPEVKELLESHVVGDLTYSDLVDRLTTPTPDMEKRSDSNTAGNRYSQIHMHIEPLFRELLLKDLERYQEPPESEESSKGSVDEGEADNDDEGGGSDEIEGGNEGEDADEGEDGAAGKKDKKEDDEGDKEGEKDKEGDSDDESDDESKAQRPSKPTSKSSKKGGKNIPELKVNPITESDVRAFIAAEKKKSKVEKKATKEQTRREGLTPEERAREHQRRADEYLAQKLNISPERLAVYRAFQEQPEMKKYARELAELFEVICKNIQTQISMQWDEYYRSGKLDVARLVKKYGQYFQRGALEALPIDQLLVFQKRVFLEKLKLKPDELRLRFVVDGSGSMGSGQTSAESVKDSSFTGDAMLQTQRLMVLFFEALAEFEGKMRRMYADQSINQPPLIVNTQFVLFGSTGVEVKGIRRGPNKNIDPRLERDERLKAFCNIDSLREQCGGSTKNDEGWRIVDSSFSPEDTERVKKGKLRDIAIEITDGGTQSSISQVTSRLRGLKKNGMLVHGVLIGEDGVDIFSKIWTKPGSTGEGLGDGIQVRDLSNFAEQLFELLKKDLESIDFSVVMEDEDDD